MMCCKDVRSRLAFGGSGGLMVKEASCDWEVTHSVPHTGRIDLGGQGDKAVFDPPHYQGH